MKEALVVIDFQNDFIDGTLGFPGAESITSGIKALIKTKRADGADILFTQDTHGEHYLRTREGRHLPVIHCLKGSDGWAIREDVRKTLSEDDQVFQKPTFGSLELMTHVAAKGYDKVTFVGLVTNICVITNAVLVKTALPEADIVIRKDLVLSFDSDLHNKALDVMEGLQMDITDGT
jgi:nicotinamidase/pyrazinamidase